MHDAPHAGPEAAVLQALDEAAAALRAGDVGRYAAAWAHEPWVSVLHPAEAEWLTGWDTIGAAYAAFLAGGARPASEIRVRTVRVAEGGDMAWVAAETTVWPQGAPVRLWQTFVLEHRAGRWRIVHAHASVPAAPGADRTGG